MSIISELTPGWLKTKFLLGVDLTLDDGSPYPDDIYTQAIKASIAYLEHELGIIIDPFKVAKERHDAYEPYRSGFWPFRLDFRPVVSIDKIQVRFGSFEAAEIPTSWAQLVSPEHGQIHLIPSEQGLNSSYSFRSGIPLITGDVLQPLRYVPGYFQFSYTAGFPIVTGALEIPIGTQAGDEISVIFETIMNTRCVVEISGISGVTLSSVGHEGFSVKADVDILAGATGTYAASTIPDDIKQAIGYKAALLPLDVAGDLIAGAGIATLSVGMDNIHHSLGTTASATNCLHPDTRIALSNGTTPTIKSLVGVPFFEVACVDDNGIARVGQGHSARRTIEDDVLAVDLSNGERVLCNASHPFRLLGGEYVPAGELREGQHLTPCAITTDQPFLGVIGVTDTGSKSWLYDLTVEDHHCFGLDQGVIVHNSGYGARVLQFERELKSLLPALRAKYKMVNVGVI